MCGWNRNASSDGPSERFERRPDSPTPRTAESDRGGGLEPVERPAPRATPGGKTSVVSGAVREGAIGEWFE
ncbi:hypothetical protein C492_12859 [Natronococcus jeotgali DSM 18795]|uniref:Uncharacterized protein n=1 Tax=Natronococcus jeotgali DSM 18795 TaxID=1227498 RepID=L9X879_9EURY|nr:hypothetical protein C492_12859 [Natronococcus jeotgali DSM 18795]